MCIIYISKKIVIYFELVFIFAFGMRFKYTYAAFLPLFIIFGS